MSHKIDQTDRRKRVSYSQLKHLSQFLTEHPEVAGGAHKSAQSREHCKRLWAKTATILNNMEEGCAFKTPIEWSKYWVDLKAKLKAKIRSYEDADKQGDPIELKLSDVDIKLLGVIASEKESKNLTIQERNHSPSPTSSNNESQNDTEIQNDTEDLEPSILQPNKSRQQPQSEVMEYIVQKDNESSTISKLNEFDEYTTFAIHIANQLRKLKSMELYINAQDEIQTILTRYRLEDLRKRSHSQLNGNADSDPLDCL